MFAAVRRCPSSLQKTLSTVKLTSRALRSPLLRSHHPIWSSVMPPTQRVAIAAFHQSAQWRQVAVAQQQAEQSSDSTQGGLITEFKDLATRGLVHPNIIRTITDKMKLQTMTEVQTRTINEALTGTDVIAQAKTGTGKTLAFLIPVVQRIIEQNPKLGEPARGYKARAKPDDIRAIVISPTRELAEQIAVEAQKVTAGTGIVVQLAVGGTQKRMMLQKTQREGCHLLVATPGRLLDIISDPYSGIKAPNLIAMVMDEADRLLDDGFSKEIEEIKHHLPDPEEVDRQTLMFSATVPRSVVDLVRSTLKPGFHFAKCVDEDEEPTHQRVPQKVVHLAGFENIMPALYELILREMRAATNTDRPFKAIIYFNSTGEVTLAASVFFKLSGGFKRDRPLHGMNAYEIHSKLSQQQRTRASDSFRTAKSAVLFSSDVTARGMDFPNVTHVIQIGLPRARESYIHRLGRTGRAGKEGEGWLLLTPFEKFEMHKRLRGLPVNEDRSLETAMFDMTAESDVPENISQIITNVVETHKKVYPDQLEAAFRGLFGAFAWVSDKEGLLEAANRMTEFGWGMPQPPNPPTSFFSDGRGRGGFRGGNRARGFNNRTRSVGFGDRQRSGGFGDRQRSGGFGDRKRSGGFGDRGGSSNGPERGGFGDRRGGQRKVANFY